MTKDSAYKLHVLTEALRAGRMNPQRYRDTLVKFLQAGEIDEELYSRLDAEAASLAMAALG